MTSKKPSRSRPASEADHARSPVEAFLARLEHPLEREILALRATILGADPSIAESIKWNAPSFHTSEHFATFQLRGTKGIQVVLHYGAKPRPDAIARGKVQDPTSLLQWRGPDRATVTFQDLPDIERRRDALAEVIRQWIAFL